MSYLKKQPNPEPEFSMPHIYWDKGFTTNPNKKPIQQNQPNIQGFPMTKEEILFKKIRDWAFYIIVGLVIIYCLYRVGKGWLF